MDQRLVSHFMTVRVIDLLEVVNVDQGKRARLLGSVRARDFASNELTHGASVSKSGQGVGSRERLGALHQSAIRRCDGIPAHSARGWAARVPVPSAAAS
jgi:hypothetical protein